MQPHTAGIPRNGSPSSISTLSDYNRVPEGIELPRTSPLNAMLEGGTLGSPPFDIIFVLGGPGAGKGTQCTKLIEYFRGHEHRTILHLSAGDLLRAEQGKQASPYAALIRDRIVQGAIVPMQITINLLKNAISQHVSPNPDEPRLIVLIDGFPRAVDQGVEFEATVAPCVGVLCLECSEEAMLKRIMHRGTSSGRDDDNYQAAIKRFETYKRQTKPVIAHFEGLGRVVKHVDTEACIGDVFVRVLEAVQGIVVGNNRSNQ